MNKFLLKSAGLAAVICSLQNPVSAQDDNVKIDTALATEAPKSQKQIIIIQHGDKDAKLNIEIKDGKVLINGKPSSEYKDGNISVQTVDISTHTLNGTVNVFGNDDFAPMPPTPPAPASPFRKRGGVTMIAPGSAWSQSSTPHAFLGVTSDEVPDGAKVTAISKGSTAEKIGLKEGDIISRVDEIKIDGPQSLSDAIHKYKPEDKVVITFKRAGKEQKLNAILGKSAPLRAFKTYNYYSAPDMSDFNFDFAPREYNGQGYYGPKAKLGIKAQDTEDGKGVKVLEVGDESPAEKAGIKEGDIITSFNGKTIESATELSAAARAAAATTATPNAPAVKIGLLRDGKPLEFEIRFPKKLKTADL